jgi:hypothetical protein
MRSAEQTGRRRPPFRQQARFLRGILAIKVSQNLLDHRRGFDAGDDLHRPAAYTAGLDVNAEYALQALCPSLESALP